MPAPYRITLDPCAILCMTVDFMAIIAVLVAVILMGIALSEPASDLGLRLIPHEPMDPLWPDHLRCLVLGAQAADDRICAALSAVDWER